jgi:hypothetical protein
MSAIVVSGGAGGQGDESGPGGAGGAAGAGRTWGTFTPSNDCLCGDPNPGATGGRGHMDPTRRIQIHNP